MSSEAFEADDFWASGDTQQFVGARRSSAFDVGPNRDPASLPRSVPGARDNGVEPISEVNGHGADHSRSARAASEWALSRAISRRLSVPRPTMVIAAALVLAVLAGTGVVVGVLNAQSALQGRSSFFGANVRGEQDAGRETSLDRTRHRAASGDSSNDPPAPGQALSDRAQDLLSGDARWVELRAGSARTVSAHLPHVAGGERRQQQQRLVLQQSAPWTHRSGLADRSRHQPERLTNERVT